MKSRKKFGPYNAMGALEALRKVGIREVEESFPSLTSEQLLEWAFVAFDARVRPGTTVAAQNYVAEHGVSFEEAERLVEKGLLKNATASRFPVMSLHWHGDEIVRYMRTLGFLEVEDLEQWFERPSPPGSSRLILVAGTRLEFRHVPRPAPVWKH
jgi:hypothetical protein